MRLQDFEKEVKGIFTRYESIVPNNDDYKLIIVGPSKIIDNSFNEANFEITIDKNGTIEDWADKIKMTPDGSEISSERISFEGLDALFKPVPIEPTKQNSVIVSLERTKPDGTLFTLVARTVRIGRGVSIFFRQPRVHRCIAVVAPLSGDADLFLRLNSMFSPITASSIRPGTLLDFVAHATIPTPFFGLFNFVPFYQTFGFTASTFDITAIAED